MKRITLITIVLTIIAMIVGTFLEKSYGSAYAIAHIYNSPWFMALLVLLLVLGLITVVRAKLYRRLATAGIHAAFALIVVGIVVTTLTARSGKIELKPSIAESHYEPKDDRHEGGTLPFSVQLIDFDIVFYPGTHAPQDFVSHVRFLDPDGSSEEATISMNHIARHHGFRFYQAGFDDEGGVVLNIAHDPWGIALSYTGYAILLLSFFGFFFDKQSRFRQLLRGGSAAVLLLVALTSSSAQAATPTPRTLPAEQAERLGQLYVSYSDRICPLQTLAIDFTTKLYGKPSYRGLSAEQVLSGWIFFYSDWCREPMFKIKGEAARHALGITGRYASLNDYITPQGTYKLQHPIDSLPFDDPARSKLLAADEKYNLIAMLYGGQLLKLFPITDSTGSLRWYSQSDDLPLDTDGDEYIFIRRHLSYCQELVALGRFDELDSVLGKTRRYQEQRATATLPSSQRIAAERLLNNLNYSRLLAMLFITLGLIAFAYYVVRTARQSDMHRPVRILIIILLSALALYLALLFVLRWVVSAHVPLSNGYETMLFLSLCIAVLALAIQHRHLIALPAGLLLVGFTLLVAMIGGSNPAITQLMPVLNSPLLSIHVAVIMISYALLAFVMLGGIAALIVGQRAAEVMASLQRIGQLLLYPAVFLLAIGIFIGAVWANVSWGTYWSWDPKEVWALITLLVYALPLHARSLPFIRSPRAFHIYVVLAFLSVLITYFGVNLLLGGMHSYA
ncbi:MAG: cytochrome c biogenesis protein CcsA [Bacteroidales bacterium]|nr:cytochrome c biogenesis protein CcsA [Bacteroidales bacterium]